MCPKAQGLTVVILGERFFCMERVKDKPLKKHCPRLDDSKLELPLRVAK